jgi:hypothetical protein
MDGNNPTTRKKRDRGLFIPIPTMYNTCPCALFCWFMYYSKHDACKVMKLCMLKRFFLTFVLCAYVHLWSIFTNFR